jgi:hypothetical protein
MDRSPPTHPPSRLPSLDTVRLLIAPALVFIVAGLDRGYQTELWQHLARGRMIAETRTLVRADPFTFTVPGRPLRDNNWLSQLLYHGLFTAGDLAPIQLVNSLSLAAAVALLVRLCHRESSSPRVAGAVGVVAFLGLWQTLLIRPQSFSMLLFVALYALLHAAGRRPKLLALAPPLMALWANVHGGFAVGLMLIGVFTAPLVWRRLRHPEPPPSPSPWLACFGGCCVATLLNPYGWSVYRYAGELSSVGVARGIEEWLPPSPGTLVGATFMLSLGAVALLGLRARRVVTLRDLLLVFCFAAPACISVRMTVWWFLAAGPVAARLFTARRVADRRTSLPADNAAAPSRRAFIGVAAIAAACLGSLPWFDRYSPMMAARDSHRTEADLADLAPALNDSRVFSRMEWSNYLAWQSRGRAKVFVEGHVELYPPDVWDRFTTVNDARPGWREVLDDYRVRFLVLDQTYHAALLSEVRRTGEWLEVARRGDAVLFGRRLAPTPGTGGDVARSDPAGGDF